MVPNYKPLLQSTLEAFGYILPKTLIKPNQYRRTYNKLLGYTLGISFTIKDNKNYRYIYFAQPRHPQEDRLVFLVYYLDNRCIFLRIPWLCEIYILFILNSYFVFFLLKINCVKKKSIIFCVFYGEMYSKSVLKTVYLQCFTFPHHPRPKNKIVNRKKSLKL